MVHHFSLRAGPARVLSIFLFSGLTAAQVSVVNGQTVYAGTAVLQNPAGVPTLVYNCAKMPSICNNVNGYGGNWALSAVPGGQNGEKGRLANVPYGVLHIDPMASRVDGRRAASCPANWKNNHACPEPNQPLVVPVPFNRGGRTVSSGFVGHAAQPNNPNRNYHILDPGDGGTGMAWTCDEFPPAFSVEGGRQANNGPLANTYCAPQASPECDDAYTRSEQDFQSSAHGRVRTPEVSGGGNIAGFAANIWELHFLTEFVDDDNSYATRVDWYIIDNTAQAGRLFGIEEISQKRKREQSQRRLLVSEHHYANGTVAQFTRPVGPDHAADHAAPGSNHSVVAPWAEVVDGGGDVTVRRFAERLDGTLAMEKRQACTATDAPAPTDGHPVQYPATTRDFTFVTAACTPGAVNTLVNYN